MTVMTLDKLRKCQDVGIVYRQVSLYGKRVYDSGADFKYRFIEYSHRGCRFIFEFLNGELIAVEIR